MSVKLINDAREEMRVKHTNKILELEQELQETLEAHDIECNEYEIKISEHKAEMVALCDEVWALSDSDRYTFDEAENELNQIKRRIQSEGLGDDDE